MIKAVIFDIDNTLLDWSGRKINWFKDPDGHLAHLAQTARAFLPTVSASQLAGLESAFYERQRRLMNEDLEEAPHLGRMLAEALHAAGITREPPSPEAALQAYDWRVTPDVMPFADVPSALATLHEAGYRFGVITNGYQPMSQRDLELAAHDLLVWLPECRFSSADVGYLKPDKRIFQVALDCLGLAPSEAVYVGDHLVMDVLGAQNIGMKAVWRVAAGASNSVGWVKPDATISDLHELPAILSAW